MIDVPLIRKAIADRMRHLEPDVHVYDVMPENPQSPAAVVGINDITFSSRDTPGQQILEVPVTAVVTGADVEERQRIIDELISTEYPRSLPPCFDDMKQAGEPWTFIILREGVFYRRDQVGTNEAFAFDLVIQVSLLCD